MTFWRSVVLRRQIRFALYILVILVLFLVRGPENWKATLRRLERHPQGPSSLTVAGRDLAPGLLDALEAAYRRDYPVVTIESRGGGTAHALDAILQRRAEVAVLARPLLETERTLFVDLAGQPPVCEAIALGALVLLASSSATVDSVSWAQLDATLRSARGELREAHAPVQRLYCEDPNLGLWDVLLATFGVERGVAENSGRIFFVRDRAELVAAVRADPLALGLVSSFTLSQDRPPEGLRSVALGGPDRSHAVLPTYANVGYGRYPLLHSLYVACRADATGEPAKFVTFAASARGQRRVERAGYLPARQVLREILLDDTPIGAR
jgi:ABC-type phosphate transport system substrate-binding protein